MNVASGIATRGRERKEGLVHIVCLCVKSENDDLLTVSSKPIKCPPLPQLAHVNF